MRRSRRSRSLLILSGSLAGGLATCAGSAWGQIGPLGKGQQWFLNNGIQVAGIIGNPAGGNPFHLATYQSLNYTTQTWEWASDPAQLSMSWGRWVSQPSNLPPVGAESAAMGNLKHLNLGSTIGDEPDLNNPAIRDQQVAFFDYAHAQPQFNNVLLWSNNYGGQVSDGPLADFIARARPDMISFDTYPYGPSAQPLGGSPTNWYGDLRRWRQHAKDTNTPLGVYRQTYASPTGAPQTRAISTSEFNLQTFAALAFNAKFLHDFTYNFNGGTLFNTPGDNTITPLGTAAAAINTRVRNLGPALVRLKPVADTAAHTTSIMFVRGQHMDAGTPVYNDFPGYIGFQIDGASQAYTDWTFGANDPYLSGFTNVTNLGTKNDGLRGDMMISWFKPLDEWMDGDDWNNEAYMMVTNALADMNATPAETRQTILLDFNQHANTQTLQVLDPNTGLVTDVALPLASGKRRYTLTLDGGSAMVFKFKTGAPFVGTMPSDAIWTNNAGGAYSTGGNWDIAAVPAASRFVHFGSTTAGSGPAYAVNFSANAAATGVFVHRDSVTWNLAGRTFNVGGFGGVDSMIVGMNSGESAALTINGGTVDVAANAGFGISVGKASGATGTLTLGSGAILNSAAHVVVGKAGTGTLNINSGATASLSNVYVGGSSTAAGGVGVMNVSGGTTTVSGTLRVWNSGAAAPGGTRLNFSGGTLNVGALETNNNPARLNWTAGNLNITGSPLTIGSGGPFGAAFSLGAGRNLGVTQQITINSGSTFTIGGGTLTASSLLNVGTFNHASGTFAASGTFTNSGPAMFSGVQSWSSGAIFTNAGGAAVFNSSAGNATTRNLHLSASSGSVTLNATQHLASLGVSGSGVVTLAADGGRAIVTNSVAATGSGRIDLKDNKLIVKGGAAGLGTWNGSAYTGISGLIDAGRGPAGAWGGAGMVTSESDAINNNDFTTLAIATAGQLGRNTIAGQSVVADDVLVMYTYGGDANLDGKINIDDYGQIDFNAPSSGSVFGYYNGDFNYDGKINIDDYGIIDFNVTAQGEPFIPSAALQVQSVPEPAGLCLAVVAASTLCRRRRAVAAPAAAERVRV